jgi:hypothetical protein
MCSDRIGFEELRDVLLKRVKNCEEKDLVSLFIKYIILFDMIGKE